MGEILELKRLKQRYHMSLGIFIADYSKGVTQTCLW